MRTILLLSALLLIGACATVPTQPAASSAGADPDPYLWLEEIDGERALAWVREQNERTRRELASVPGFEEMRQQALTALSSQSRVPNLTIHGPYIYNLWKDASHPRGLYRRTTIDQLRRGTPQWTTVLDIDEMSRRDNQRWVFQGMECLPPAYRRCLMRLSPAGGDAVEIREFDAETLRFVEGGFSLPLAKQNVEWIDEDSIFVSTNFGEGTLTESGYPRVVKLWRRGTPLTAASTIYQGSPSSVSSYASRYRYAGGAIDLIEESLTTWQNKFVHLPQLSGSAAQPTQIPAMSDVIGAISGRLVLLLHEAWGTAPAGAVVTVDPRGSEQPSIVVAPTESSVVEDVEVTDHGIYVAMLENVRGRLHLYRPRSGGGWDRQVITFPDNGSLSIMDTDDKTGDALISFETFTTPPALYHVSLSDARPVQLVAQQPTFEGARFETRQFFAVSKDGTRIPYFVVGPRDMKMDGSNPAHIFSYGGFRNALTPSYSGSYEPHYGAYGKLWLERGGVFVLANIRGGGEFGPRWHAAALKENRYKIYEDFEAVAEDLIRRRITSAGRLGIEGRSQGGLLTLSTMVRRPDLYGAVIAGVPLADMQRYHELLAGASWMGEYGDPRIPAEWEYIRQYSPYQNFRPESVRDYPPLFIFGSMRDDRVHPGHGRKVVAKLQEMGHEVWYYENIEGGHGGSVTPEQTAYRIALSYAHLWKWLGR